MYENCEINKKEKRNSNVQKKIKKQTLVMQLREDENNYIEEKMHTKIMQSKFS